MTEKQFDKLGKARKRIVIMEDVLLNLKSNAIYAKKGVYVATDDQITYSEGKEDVRENFGKLKECPVCMMGACLLSVIKFKNQVKFEQLNCIVSTDYIWRKVKLYFDDDQLALMEYAFEKVVGQDRVGRKDDTSMQNIKATVWGAKYKTEEKRMKAICRNVIRNKGTFKI